MVGLTTYVCPKCSSENMCPLVLSGINLSLDTRLEVDAGERIERAVNSSAFLSHGITQNTNEGRLKC